MHWIVQVNRPSKHVRVALGAPGVIRTHDPLLRRYFALSAVLPWGRPRVKPVQLSCETAVGDTAGHVVKKASYGVSSGCRIASKATSSRLLTDC